MKKFFILLSIIITNYPSVFAHRQSCIIERHFGSIVMVRGYTEGGSLAYGSGVIVGKGEVITNCHVLRRTKSSLGFTR